MVQVELRASTSTLRFCNSVKRSLASSGMKLTFFGSSKIAAEARPVAFFIGAGEAGQAGVHAAIHGVAADGSLQRFGVVAVIGKGGGGDHGGNRATDRQTGAEIQRDPLRSLFIARATSHGHISGCWRTITLVPSGMRSYRSITSGLTRRKHPDDTAVPMVCGALVPWMR